MPALRTLVNMTTDIEARELEQAIVAYCKERNLDFEVVGRTCADLVGRMAVLYDRQTGKRSLQDRLDAFCERASETYSRTYDIAETMALK